MSVKNHLSVIILGLLLIVVMGCSDSNADLSPIPLNDLAGEEPLTEYDLGSYIAMLPEIAPVEYVDGQKASEVYKKFGLSRLRYKYIQSKIQYCSAFRLGLEDSVDFSKLPDSLKPNEAELSIVGGHWDAFQAALQIYRERVVLK